MDVTEAMRQAKTWRAAGGKVISVAVAETLAAEVERLRDVMRAVASMPGRDWLAGQLALSETLDGNGERHIAFVMKQAQAAAREE